MISSTSIEDGTSKKLSTKDGQAEEESIMTLNNMDEENVMLSHYAKSINKATKSTKINNNTYDNIISTLDIGSIIHPKHITAENILQYVRAMQNSIGSNVETLYRLVDGRAEALEFTVKEKGATTDTPLQALELKSNLLVCAIHRKGKVIIPKGQDCLQVGDSVIIITTDCGKLNDIEDILSRSSSASTARQTKAEGES